MIFLFFGTSLALLEAELGPFKDLAKSTSSSEFNPENYEHVKSSPSLKVWSHENVKDTVKFDKRVKLRVPKKCFYWKGRVKIYLKGINKS